MMQSNHEYIFQNIDKIKITTTPEFSYAHNGVYYKSNLQGSSVYYSSTTKINQKEQQKVLTTEAMDPFLKDVVENNQHIIASYFNSYDNMNRLYPYIEKVYDQYGDKLNMEEFNFYYLADLQHNPEKKPVWTQAYLDPAGNNWMVSCVVPIYKNNFLEGVSGLDITIDTFSNKILNKQLPYDTKIFLVDTKGTILAMPNAIEKLLGLQELQTHNYTEAITNTVEKPSEYDLFTNTSKFAKHFKSMIEKNQGTSSITIDEHSYITFNKLIPQTNWNLMLIVDKDNLFEATYSLNKLYTNIGIGLVIFMFLFYIAYFLFLRKSSSILAKNITKPIQDLSHITSDVGSNQDIKLHSSSNITEIDQLYSNFQTMINELEDRTKLLLHKSKHAAMGEMMDAIAHQWKQPLSVISAEATMLSIVHSTDKDIHKTVNHLVETIDSFRHFFRPNIPKENVNLYTIIQEVLDLEKTFLIKNKVTVTFTGDKICNYSLISSEFKHVFINMIQNTLFAFEEKNIEERNIHIDIQKLDSEIKITFTDNAGGIDKNIIDTIFQANVSSKGSQGTGVGLYLSQQIIDKLGGTIHINNKEWSDQNNHWYGASFTIICPL